MVVACVQPQQNEANVVWRCKWFRALVRQRVTAKRTHNMESILRRLLELMVWKSHQCCPPRNTVHIRMGRTSVGQAQLEAEASVSQPFLRCQVACLLPPAW